MTLGRPSALLLSILLTTFTGCAYGDVNGSRGTDTSSRDESQPAPSSNGGTSGSSSNVSGPADYDAMFDAPADPTTTEGSILGLWAGRTYSGESRIKITEDKVVIAMKCGDAPANGLEVGALVTEDQIKILASKSATSNPYGCGIKVSPTVIKRCTSSSPYGCFAIEDSTLSFSDVHLFTGDSSALADYTKLSD